MSKRPEQIISDEEIEHVHGFANFGDMSKRAVVDDGVTKYAVGYTGGSIQMRILYEHDLITKPRGTSYNAFLTKKGKLYAREIYRDHFDAASIVAQRDELLAQLGKAAQIIQDAATQENQRAMQAETTCQPWYERACEWLINARDNRAVT